MVCDPRRFVLNRNKNLFVYMIMASGEHRVENRQTAQSITLSLFSYILVVLLIRDLIGDGLVPQLRCHVRPLLKLCNGHFLFHIAGIVCLVCAVVSLPHRIGLAFVIISFPCAYIATDLAGLALDGTVTITEIFARTNQEEPSALLAPIREIIMFEAVEEIIKQK